MWTICLAVLSSSGSPRWWPPRPRAEIFTPVRPKSRIGMPLPVAMPAKETKGANVEFLFLRLCRNLHPQLLDFIRQRERVAQVISGQAGKQHDGCRESR